MGDITRLVSLAVDTPGIYRREGGDSAGIQILKSPHTPISPLD